MAVSRRGEEAEPTVNEHEGTVLSVIARSPGLTRYKLLAELKRSPTSSYNTSKGSLYPLITRMMERGYVTADAGSGRHDSELLKLTSRGQSALTRWVLATGPEQSLSHDPLLQRIMSLGDLPPLQRVQWIASAKEMLLQKKEELERYEDSLDPPYRDIVRGTASAMLQAKLEWLDRLLIEVVKDIGTG